MYCRPTLLLRQNSNSFFEKMFFCLYCMKPMLASPWKDIWNYPIIFLAFINVLTIPTIPIVETISEPKGMGETCLPFNQKMPSRPMEKVISATDKSNKTVFFRIALTLLVNKPMFPSNAKTSRMSKWIVFNAYLRCPSS